MSDTYQTVVVGGGFRSIAAAYAMAKNKKSVVLIESGKSIGGCLSPIQWDEYWIDKGPQFFDNFSPDDRAFMDEMLGEDILKDIGFKYGSYLSGHRTDGFAIPDWRLKGENFVNQVFQELITKRIKTSQQNGTFQAPDLKTLADLIIYESGQLLSTDVLKLSNKFLKIDAEAVSANAHHAVSFCGRKLLFDQDVSLNLKKASIIDDLLAAQKVGVTEDRFNLYPKGATLEKVRLAMISALEREGVEIRLETSIKDIDIDSKIMTLSTGKLKFDNIFLGCDIRDSEKLMLGKETISEYTHVLPEIFHCFVVEKKLVDPSYYIVNYDLNHVSTRITNFCNYMKGSDDDKHGVICIEQAIDRGSKEWNEPAKDQLRVFEEAREVGNISCDTFLKAKSFRIPSTYKVPLNGLENKVESFLTEIEARYGENIIIPSAYTLTRQETMDDLRKLEII